MNLPLGRYWELLAQYLKPMRFKVGLLAILIFTGIGFRLLNPQIIRYFIDTAMVTSDSQPLLVAAAAFLGVSLLLQAIGVASTYVGEDIGWQATNQLRADLALHCLRLDMSFHNDHTPGEMIERIDGDVADIAIFFAEFVIRILGNVLLLIGVLIVLAYEDWRVSLALGIFTILSFIGLTYLRQIAVVHWKAARQASADLFGFLEEQLSGTEDTRSSGAVPYVLRNLFKFSKIRLDKELKGASLTILIVMMWVGLFTAGQIIAMVSGYFLYQGGLITVGTVFLIILYTNIIFQPLREITNQIQNLQKSAASIERVESLKNLQSIIKSNVITSNGSINKPVYASFPRSSVGMHTQERSNTVCWPTTPCWPNAGALDREVEGGETPYSAEPAAQGMPSGPLAVEFDDVTFGYVETEPVLHNVSFQLQPGDVLGLLGRTGSGKTTLTRLLFRLYDPATGSIKIGVNGSQIDIRQAPLADLRQSIGMVTQDVQLFRATVRDNLTFFNKDIPDEKILDVISELELLTWFNTLPDGLDTELQTEGSSLSAGEAQLLAFTRVFLHNPSLVILDEASSRLDPATEQLIERAVDKLLKNRTGIIIAHRLSTVHRADHILIIESGRIREFGQYDDLVHDPGSRFYNLLQTGLEEVLV